MIYDQHIVSVLTLFYLDKGRMTVYHGRWDTYLAAKGLWDEYFYLMLKTDNQIAKLLLQAKEKATEVTTSPLAQALKEET